MTTKPKTRKAPAAKRQKSNVVQLPKTIDPIFAAIDEHKRLDKKWSRLLIELQNAEAVGADCMAKLPVDRRVWDHRGPHVTAKLRRRVKELEARFPGALTSTERRELSRLRELLQLATRGGGHE